MPNASCSSLLPDHTPKTLPYKPARLAASLQVCFFTVDQLAQLLHFLGRSGHCTLRLPSQPLNCVNSPQPANSLPVKVYQWQSTSDSLRHYSVLLALNGAAMLDWKARVFVSYCVTTTLHWRCFYDGPVIGTHTFTHVAFQGSHLKLLLPVFYGFHHSWWITLFINFLSTTSHFRLAPFWNNLLLLVPLLVLMNYFNCELHVHFYLILNSF